MDVICRWRDAIDDPPPDGWNGLARHKYSHGYGHWFHVWYASGEYMDDDGDVIMDVDSEWLDVTDVPAVPMAKVQAAVDEIACTYGGYPGPDITPPQAADGAIDFSVDAIANHTGITPTEVQ